MIFGVYTAFLIGLLVEKLSKTKTEQHISFGVLWSVLAMVGVIVVGVFPALSIYLGTTAPANIVETVLLGIVTLLTNLGAYALGVGIVRVSE